MKKKKSSPPKSDKKQTRNNSVHPIKEGHPLKKEIRGIVFLLLAVLIGGSLLSHSHSDKLFWNVAGHLGKAHNLFGTVGAHVSGGLFDLLGIGAFWVPLIFFVLSFITFKGRSLSSPVKGMITVLIMLASFSALLSLRFEEGLYYRGTFMAAGGLVGLHMAGLSITILNTFGSYVFLAAIFAISLLMVTRLSFGWIFSRIGLWILGIFKKIREILTKRKERKKRAQKTLEARGKIKKKPKVNIVETAIKAPPPPPRQEKFSFMQKPGDFQLPTLDLLNTPPKDRNVTFQRDALEMNARRLEKKLEDFGVDGEVVEILPGPVITMYEYKPAPGVKISKVAGLSDDLALTLRAQSIRIVAPIPGKAAIGIEIPNNQRETVYLQEMLSSSAYTDTKSKLPIALGKDITGSAVVADLAKMPHLLVAGATGTGKSVSLNAMIQSLLFSLSPETARFLMVDPKRIELSVYQDIPHLLHPVVTQPKDANKALKWAVREMERRYMLLSDRGVRNIDSYNRKIVKEDNPKDSAEENGQDRGIDRHLPYIIIIIDELADLMMVSSKEVEESITRLAQMARAAGIHLIIATQRPSVNVLTGIIKANFPTRLSFQVSSKVDSRTILDTNGAEHLLGDGDMLFMPPGVGRIMRIHGAYISEEEVKRVADFLRNQKKPDYDETILSHMEEDDLKIDEPLDLDEKFDEAVEVVCQSGQASISMLQRRLRVGYNRAARMIEAMEAEGIVGPSDGVRPRDVYGRKGG
ncbi:MAG: DNA translocase FtsK 4TM domain-containing protein [Deltaproteobacteria bacterium]|nr:DNA translocase FtsK 4TM domain-containing protein [Deltaproteobacteria bacterium]